MAITWAITAWTTNENCCTVCEENSQVAHASQTPAALRAARFRCGGATPELHQRRGRAESHPRRHQPRRPQHRGPAWRATVRTRHPFGESHARGRRLCRRGRRGARPDQHRHHGGGGAAPGRGAQCQHLRWFCRPLAGAAALPLPSRPPRYRCADLDLGPARRFRPRRRRYRHPLRRRRLRRRGVRTAVGGRCVPGLQPRTAGW